MELFTKIITVVNDIVWHPACLFFLGGAAIWFTLRLKGLQFTGLPSMFHYMFEKESDELGEAKGLSAFQALATTVGGRVGTGNIAGSATAIFLGGPGALFWMWMAAERSARNSSVSSKMSRSCAVKSVSRLELCARRASGRAAGSSSSSCRKKASHTAARAAA